ncbi:MAG: hypothetical protein V4617_02080 [Gemmatimonadota bacterium]
MLSLLTACGGSADDATTMDADSAGLRAEPQPPVLSAEAINGTWSGVSMGEVGDSVTFRWTYTRNADGTAGFVYAGSSDTVRYATVVSGDSIVSTSEPYTPPKAPDGSPQVVVRTVGRLVGDKLVGTSAVRLATSPDSVVARGRWEATRAP